MRLLRFGFRLFQSVTFSVVILIALSCHNISAQEVKQAEIDGVAQHWVMQETTGRVFATLSDRDEVIEFDSNGKEVRRIEVNTSPGQMMIKGDMLIVGCTKSPSLVVIDLTTNQKKGEIKLNGKGPYSFFCSQVDNSFVYCVCNTGTAWWDGKVFQCDLKTMKIRKEVAVSTWRQSHVIHVAMSPDGNWIVPDARGASSPSGADLMKVNEEECTFEQLQHHHDSFGPIVAAPSNRFWALGKALYSQDLSKMLRTFGGEPVAFHPNLDLVASLSGTDLLLEQFSDASLIAKLSLNAKPQSSEKAGKTSTIPFNHDSIVRIDSKGQRVFVGTPTKAYWVDVSEIIKMASEQNILLVPSQLNAVLGKEIKVPLSATGINNKTEMEIAEGPKDAKIVDGHLVWRPSADDVGEHTLKLDLKLVADQRIVDSVDINLSVGPVHYELGFPAIGLEVSPGAKYLVAWGPSPGQNRAHPSHVGSDDLAVVDIQEQKVIAKKTIPQGIRCVTIDDNFVFVAPHSGNLIYRLSPQLGDSQRVFIQASPSRLIRLGKSWLLTQSDIEANQLIDIQEMKPLNAGIFGIRQNSRFSIIANDQCVLIENRLIDRKTGELLRTVGTAKLPALVKVQNNSQPVRFPNSGIPTWGRMIESNSLVTANGSRIATFPGDKITTLSAEFPVAVSMDMGLTDPNRMLSFINITDGSTIQAAKLSTKARTNSSMAMVSMQRALVLRGDKIFCLDQNRVLVSEIPEEVKKTLSIPPHFGPTQLEVIEADKPFKFKPRVVDGSNKLTFSLLMEYEGLSIDSETGEVSIDTPMLWNAFSTNFRNNIFDFSRFSSNPAASDVGSVQSETASQYKLLTGKDLPKDKIAAEIPISIALESSDGLRDEISYSLIVVGNFTEIAKRFEKQKVEQEKQMTDARAEQEKRRAELEANRNPPPNRLHGEGDPNARLEALENRVRRMEAALDAILKKLDEKKP